MASVYSPEQIVAFLNHIGLPASLRHTRFSGNPRDDLHLLTQLHIHTISTVPYENLSIHYSPTHQVDMKPLVVFDKIVTARRNRGGYCYEVNTLYNHILRGLGFPVYTAPVRVRLRTDGVPEGPFKGWTHLVNIVHLSDGSRWMSDTGFGGDGPTAPLPIRELDVHSNLGPQQNRLVRDWIPSQALRTPASRLWIYQYRNAEHLAWNSFYAFAEFEATEDDLAVSNQFAGHHPSSFQTFRPLVVKFLRRDADGQQEGARVVGKRMLVDGTVKENLGGRTSVIRECASEEERIAALREVFGMEFTQEERDGIKGWRTELK